MWCRNYRNTTKVLGGGELNQTKLITGSDYMKQMIPVIIHSTTRCLFLYCNGGRGGRVVKPLGSKQEVPGSNPGAAEIVGQ